jgi:lambda repressor-like predicted transcriptional regulator
VDQRALTAYSKRLQEIADLGTSLPLHSVSRGVSWESGGVRLTLPMLAAIAFFELAGDLAQDRLLSERVAESVVQERLKQILIELHSGRGTDLAAMLREFVDETENYSTRQIVYVPVEHVILEVASLQIGQVVLRKADESFCVEAPQLAARSDMSLEDIGQLNESLIERLKQELRGKLVAEFCTIAEPVRARERAIEETRRALEVLTFANAALYYYHPRADAAAALDGELPTIAPRIPVISDGMLHTSITRTPTSWPIELSPEKLERLDEVGFWQLVDLLGHPRRTLSEFGQALLRSVHWFAASQAQVELENRLLNLITSLEALVGPKNREPISTYVAEAVALLIADEYESRVRVKKFLADAYRARSAVSHGGDKVVSKADVDELRWIVSTLLGKLIGWQNGIQTRDDLLNWLEKAKLAGNPVDPPVRTQGKSIRQLREERGWSLEELAERVPRASMDSATVEYWEGHTVPSAELRFLADALGVHPQEIALPRTERWLNVRGHLFHLTANWKGAGQWVARISGWDYNEAMEWPKRAVDPATSDSDSPTALFEWRSEGYTAALALTALANVIESAMQRALSAERLPEEPLDWQPPEIPRHWQQHLEAKKRRRKART